MKYLTLTAIMAGSLAANCAFANVGYQVAPPVYFMGPQLNSFYISGDVGAGTLSTPDENFPTDGSASYHHVTSVAGGGNVGFNRFINPMLALGAELGYEYNGRAEYSNGSDFTGKLTSTDFHVLATGTVFFRNGFNIFGKVGGADVHEKLEITDLDDTTATAIKPMAAAGIGYRFRMVDIYGQYSHIFAKNADDFSDLFDSNGNLQIVSADAFKLGLAFHLNI